MWKVVRLAENNLYRPIFDCCNLTYVPGQWYQFNPEYQGPFCAFKTYDAAKAFALEFCEFAIFECDGVLSELTELRWDTTSGVNWINQGIRAWPYGTIFLRSFVLQKKVAEMVNGHFTELP